MFLLMLFCSLFSYKTKRHEILPTIEMNLKNNTDFLIPTLDLPYEYKQKRCGHTTDECKQKEVFVSELFQTVQDSLYKDLRKEKKKKQNIYIAYIYRGCSKHCCYLTLIL